MAEKDDVIDGYQLTSLIARGNVSQIWEVTPTGGGDALAMKLLLPQYTGDKEQILVLKTEAKVGKAMTHENLMGCKEIKVTKEHAYLLMDYFRSGNLKTEMTNDPLAIRSRMVRLTEGMCNALEFMHSKGWVHRDVKPDNILMSRGSELKLIDYSLSRKFGMFAGKPTAIQGTRTYIAPETISKKAPTPQTDMYSLGITLYEVLAGRTPFRSKNPNHLLLQHLKEKPVPINEINPNITEEMSLVIQKLLEKKPANRPKKIVEFLTEFRATQLFKEDIYVVQERKEKAAAEVAANDIDSARRLDSRADALRDKSEDSSPEISVKKATPPPPQPVAQQPAPQVVAPPAQQPPVMQPQPIMPQQPIPPQYIPQPGAMPVAGQYPMMPGYAPMQPGQVPPMPYPQGTQPPAQYPMQPMQQPGMPIQPQPGIPLVGEGQPSFIQPAAVPPAQPPTAIVPEEPLSPVEVGSPSNPVSQPVKKKQHASQLGVDEKELEVWKDLPDIS